MLGKAGQAKKELDGKPERADTLSITPLGGHSMATSTDEITVTEACERLNAAGIACTAPTVRAWLDAGTLRGRTAPRPTGVRYIRILAASVESLIRETLEQED